MRYRFSRRADYMYYEDLPFDNWEVVRMMCERAHSYSGLTSRLEARTKDAEVEDRDARS